jgi:hypothetical protein
MSFLTFFLKNSILLHTHREDTRNKNKSVYIKKVLHFIWWLQMLLQTKA